MQASTPVNRRVVNLLVSNLSSFFILALFIGLAFAASAWLTPSKGAEPVFSTTGLVVTGVLMALVPAAIWLFFFYRQDRREPEPKGMVLQVFVLGMLLAAAIGIPLVEDAFDVSSWMYSSPWASLAASILLIGFIQEFLKFAAVRFSVYQTAEFNERTDGVIYSIAAGLGFAVVLNISFIINSGGADLGMAAVRLTLTSLAQASFAGISGYFLAREKLDGKPAWWLPLGVALAALLNGLFFFLWGALTRPVIGNSGAFVNIWAGLILAAVLALLTMALLTWLIQRDQARHPLSVDQVQAEKESAQNLPPFMNKRRLDAEAPEGLAPVTRAATLSALLVIGLTLLAVFFGWLVKTGQESGVRQVEINGLSASYPANWKMEKGLLSEPLLFSVSDPFKPGLGYTVTDLQTLPGNPPQGGNTLDMLAMQRNLQRGSDLPMYRIFEQTPVEYKDADAGYMVHFAYVDPRGSQSLPLVVEGVEYYLQYGERVVLVTLEDDSQSFSLDQPGFMAFLDSIVVGEGE